MYWLMCYLNPVYFDGFSHTYKSNYNDPLNILRDHEWAFPYYDVFLFLRIIFTLKNSVDTDGSSLFVKEPIKGFPVYRGFKNDTHG